MVMRFIDSMASSRCSLNQKVLDKSHEQNFRKIDNRSALFIS